MKPVMQLEPELSRKEIRTIHSMGAAMSVGLLLFVLVLALLAGMSS
ncbi:MAG: hypothetical protein IBX52_06685 [Bacterioplanes sp.]|nr:hypothetical protein [Bacterioplanes sp.]